MSGRSVCHGGRSPIGHAGLFPGLHWLPLLVLCGQTAVAAAGQPLPDATAGRVTDSAAVRALIASPETHTGSVCLEGTVYFVSAARDSLVLGDDQGLVELEVELGPLPVACGDRVRLEGTGELGQGRVRLRRIPVVDNDGLHGEAWREGQIHLTRGLHRFELGFFQAGGESLLRLNWSGPGFAERPLESDALFRRPPEATVAPEAPEPGLEFAFYPGLWDRLPDFEHLRPAQTGLLPTYDPTGAPSPTNFALRLTAWLHVTHDGAHTFRMGSDDGSRLFIDATAPALTPLGRGPLRPARRVDSDIQLVEIPDVDFVELEGSPEFVAADEREIRIQLRRGSQRFETHLAGMDQVHPALLANCRLRLRGVLQRVLDESGQPGAHRFLVDGLSGLRAVVPQPSLWRMVAETPLPALERLADRTPLVRTTGTLVRGTDGTLQLSNATGQVTLQLIGAPPDGIGRLVEVVGSLGHAAHGVALTGAVWRPPPSSPEAEAMLLTTLEQVHRLPREELRRQRPVDVTATVVLSLGGWLFVRDATRAIYVAGGWPGQDAPKVGEVYRLEGHTLIERDGYTPFLKANQVTRIGRAVLPEPWRPSWDDLMTGRLDAQWIELGGMVSSVTTSALVLAMPGGQLTASVPSGGAVPANLEGAMVRIRGCCTVAMTEAGQILSISVVLQGWDSVSAVLPAPTDPFALPLRPIGGLLSYDADLLPHVKIAGVVLHHDPALSFVSDGTNGVRVVARTTERLRPGDAVELVGVLDVMTQAPVIRDATIHRTGVRPLPPPGEPTPKELATGRWDARLIRTEGRLLNVTTNSLEQVLEVQLGDQVTSARLNARHGTLRHLRLGSTLELVGVCNGRYADDLTTKGFDHFELLLSSPASVRVLTAPSWWTTRHTLGALGLLLAGLLLAAGWIAALRHRVARRTRELHIEIEGHKRTEAKLVREMAERQRAQDQVETTHKALLVASRKVGMAEVATSVLHNVGNVLNSVNISATILTDRIKASAVQGLTRAAALVEEHREDLAAFITDHPRGRHLPVFLKHLATTLQAEHQVVLQEAESLRRHVDHIKEIVAMQQSLAKSGGVQEIMAPTDILEDALLMSGDGLARHQITLKRAYGEALGTITADKHKILQILINLVANAKHACAESDHPHKQITLEVRRQDHRVRWSVEDNGVGIASENLTRIFNYGFTTRKNGHGFGLHSGALAARELGGHLTALSLGPGQGARFTLELPANTPCPEHPSA